MASYTLWFRKRNGHMFKRRFKSLSSAKRAVRGWTAKGGEMEVNAKRFLMRRGIRHTSQDWEW